MKGPEQQPVYEAFINSAVVLPKGVLGKTVDPLLGCMVPIIIHDTSLILGHFGPNSYEKTRHSLKKNIDGWKNPSAVLMYHVNLVSSFSNGYDEDYEYWLSHMRDTLGQVVHIPAEHIELRTYEMNSEVIVDWRAHDYPLIYTQPIVQNQAS